MLTPKLRTELVTSYYQKSMIHSLKCAEIHDRFLQMAAYIALQLNHYAHDYSTSTTCCSNSKDVCGYFTTMLSLPCILYIYILYTSVVPPMSTKSECNLWQVLWGYYGTFHAVLLSTPFWGVINDLNFLYITIRVCTNLPLLYSSRVIPLCVTDREGTAQWYLPPWFKEVTSTKRVPFTTL